MKVNRLMDHFGSIPAEMPDMSADELSEMPDPEWYLEQFRSHIGMIHQLFKACPPQQWKTLSSAIGDALAEVGEKAGLKVDRYIQNEDMSEGKRDLEVE